MPALRQDIAPLAGRRRGGDLISVMQSRGERASVPRCLLRVRDAPFLWIRPGLPGSGVLSFLFFAKKKGPKKTRPQLPGGYAHAPRGLTVCFM